MPRENDVLLAKISGEIRRILSTISLITKKTKGKTVKINGSSTMSMEN